ncbi:DUF2382 domain-containing protein [Tessaracoccus sp.]
MMIRTSDVERLLDSKASVHDSTGDKVGSLGQIYLDDQTGEPSWATVKTGLFGMSESFVSLEGASLRGDDLHVGYTKDQINDAPNIDEDNHLDPAEEDRLYEYYAGQGSDHPSVSGEDVTVDTERHERVRLRKYVVAENMDTTVPVQHEEARLAEGTVTDQGAVNTDVDNGRSQG